MEWKKVFKKIEQLDDVNAHGEAIELFVKELADRNMTSRDNVEKMQHINALHYLYGCLTPELYKLRTDIWEGVRDKFYELNRL